MHVDAEGGADRAVVRSDAGGDFDVAMEANCQSVVNPLLDIGKYLPHTVYTENYGNYEDPSRDRALRAMLHETDLDQAARAMREFEKIRARHRGARDRDAVVVPHRAVSRSYVKGWKISPSHYLNQDLANIWLDK